MKTEKKIGEEMRTVFVRIREGEISESDAVRKLTILVLPLIRQEIKAVQRGLITPEEAVSFFSPN